MTYDIFYVSQFAVNDKNWQAFHDRFPLAQKIENINSFKDIKSKAFTKMFWVVWDDVIIADDFDFDYTATEWDTTYVHIFKNEDDEHSVALFPKSADISNKELTHRFYINTKLLETVACYPRHYDKFVVNNYDDYKEALKNTTTELFWCVPDSVVVADDFKFDMYFPHSDVYNRSENHVFLNDELHDGVMLLSINTEVSKKEIDNRFLVSRKEWDIVASSNKLFDKFVVNNYDDYKEALKNTTTELFWAVPDSVVVANDFKFDMCFPYSDVYNRSENHVFLNDELHDGIMLLSANNEVSKKEIDHRFLVSRKEWDIVASSNKLFDKFVVNNYDDYKEALKNTTTELFWCVPDSVVVADDFKFDMCFPYSDVYNRSENHVFLNDELHDGIMLLSINNEVSKKEIDNRFLVSRKEWNIVASSNRRYDKFVVNNYDDYKEALKNTTTELFWAVPDSVVVADDFKFDMYFTFDDKYNRSENHVFLNDELYDGIMLLNTNNILSEKEINNRFIVSRKEWDIVASSNRLYDKFIIDNYDDYKEALKNTTTELFWSIPSNVSVANNFKFDICFVHSDKYNRSENHVFLNDQLYDGIMLLNAKNEVTKKEIDHRFLIKRKEWPIVASLNQLYDKFVVNNYEEYQEALKNTTTELCWIVPNDVIVADNFKFDLCFTHNNEYNRKENHVFLNGESYDGVMLVSKHKPVTKKEINYRCLLNCKQWSIVASTPAKYATYVLSSYSEYLHAFENSPTELFWSVPKDVNVADDFKFDLYFPYSDRYNRAENHMFLNDKWYDGVMLLSQHKKLAKQEFTNRFITQGKEWDIVASTPKLFDKFIIDNYDDYLKAKKEATSDMFWCIWPENEVTDQNIFKKYFSHHNLHDRGTHHVFKHIFRNRDTYANGVSLLVTDLTLNANEINHRFLAKRKEWPDVVSRLKPYDIVFISYDEENADKNYKKLLAKYPRAKRVHHVEGIHNAHIKAAKMCSTDMFWVVDADAEIVDDFKFDHEVTSYEKGTVHVWRSQNPINNLQYGYGGVKLLPRQLTINMNMSKPDMTTAISSKFRPVQEVSNITRFNTDPFSTWRSAFRECVKLSSKIIDRQHNDETIERLDTWCSVGADQQYGIYSIAGALAGREYGQLHKDDVDALRKINDFNWLYSCFVSSSKSIQ